MKRTLVLAISVLAVCVQLSAYDFMVDKLCYNINADGESVTVTYQNNSSPRYSDLSGALEIPPSVSHDGVTYAVTTIGQNAFCGCESLTSLSIPESVTSIGNFSFYECSGLKGALTIPNSVLGIGRHAFMGCVGLASVTVSDSVTDIGAEAFSDCTGLTFVAIGNSVTEIGKNAFTGCIGLRTVVWKAKNCIDFYSPDFAPFSNQTNITTFTFGNEVERIPTCLCYGLTGLTSLTISNSVTYIGNSAFRNCSGLTSVTIPQSISVIGNNAFSGCIGLRSVVWEAERCCGSSDSESAPFANLSNITSFTFGNSVEIIPSYLCFGLTGLTSLSIPNSVTMIDYNAFKNCSGLTSVTIPQSITEIGINVFSGCIGLRSVVWEAKKCHDFYGPEDVPFANLINITSFTFGNKVETLPSYLCYGLSGLTSVTIPGTVTEIGKGTFGCCSGLTSVTNMALIPQSIKSSVFENVDMSACKLYVWHESISDYHAADVWKDFDIQDLGGVEGVVADAEAKTVEGYYNLQGVCIDEPIRGQVSIVRYTDGSAKKIVVR